MKDVYEKMDSHFSNVSAHAITNQEGKPIGRILFHYSRGGVVTAYVQEWGFSAITGKAGGYGYDKKGAALYDAIKKALKNDETKDSPLYKALESVTYDGEWLRLLENAGYKIQYII